MVDGRGWIACCRCAAIGRAVAVVVVVVVAGDGCPVDSEDVTVIADPFVDPIPVHGWD